MTHYLKTIADKLVRTTRDSAGKTRTGKGRKTDAVAYAAALEVLG